MRSQACEGNGAHNHHALLKIRNPAQAPAGILTILREEQPGPDAREAPAAEDDEDWRRLRAGEATWGDVSRGGRHMFRRWFGAGRGHHGGGGHPHGHGWGGRGRSAERGGCGRWRRGASAEGAVDTSADAVELQKGIAASVASAPAAFPAPAPAAPAAAASSPAPGAPSGPRAHFVAHLTLGDSLAPLAPGARLQKVWRLRNEGAAAWPEGWCVRRWWHVRCASLTRSLPPPPPPAAASCTWAARPLTRPRRVSPCRPRPPGPTSTCRSPLSSPPRPAAT